MKKLVVGILIGFVLAFTASAYADQIESLVGRTIEGEFPVTINGERLEKKAIVIDGTSYLPVRAIAEAVYQNVYFDADLGIALTKKEEEPVISQEPSTRDKEDLKLIESKINYLKHNIESGNEYLALSKKELENETVDSNKSSIQKKIDYLNGELDKYKSQLADYERQKADLEAAATK